jgi:hypothetical protein
MGFKKTHFTVMLAVYVCGDNMPLYIILYHKTVAKEQLPGGITVRCQLKGCWITNELKKDWLLVEWNRRPGVLLGKQGMLVLDAYKGHLTLEIEATVTCCLMDTDQVVIHDGLPCNCKW